MFPRILQVFAGIAGIGVALAFLLRATFGGGLRLDDRSSIPSLGPAALERVANLDFPPGNLAVSREGRLFFSFHPDGNPPSQVQELVNGTPEPFPDQAMQGTDGGEFHFRKVLAVRVDRQSRLWVLDHAGYALEGTPRLMAFDTSTRKLVHRHDFSPEVAGFLSMVNDFQIDPNGERIYIAEASPIRGTPAIIVYDVRRERSRRVLHGHPSVLAKPYILQAPGRDMIFFGFYTMRVGVDSIALDRRGEWLFYGPLSGDRLSRIATRDLDDESLSPAELAAKVEDYGPKPLSDGLTTDLEGNVYITDPEHSAILSLGPDRVLRTLVKDRRLRWPDGLSFGPEGWLYVTCSSLQDVLFVGAEKMRRAAPFQIYRFRPGPNGIAGQ